jgi:hypothetical protein
MPPPPAAVCHLNHRGQATRGRAGNRQRGFVTRGPWDGTRVEKITHEIQLEPHVFGCLGGGARYVDMWRSGTEGWQVGVDRLSMFGQSARDHPRRRVVTPENNSCPLRIKAAMQSSAHVQKIVPHIQPSNC